jgi:hypothetical protein
VRRLSRGLCLYSGYLKLHGLKVLTVIFPNGIIAYLFGSVSAWENDIGLLNLYWLTEPLVALQQEIAAARMSGKTSITYPCLETKSSITYSVLHMHMSLLEEENFYLDQGLMFWP